MTVTSLHIWKNNQSKLRTKTWEMNVTWNSIFADASDSNLSDGGNQLGYLIMLVGDDGKFSLLNWQSK